MSERGLQFLIGAVLGALFIAALAGGIFTGWKVENRPRQPQRIEVYVHFDQPLVVKGQ